MSPATPGAGGDPPEASTTRKKVKQPTSGASAKTVTVGDGGSTTLAHEQASWSEARSRSARSKAKKAQVVEAKTKKRDSKPRDSSWSPRRHGSERGRYPLPSQARSKVAWKTNNPKQDQGRKEDGSGHASFVQLRRYLTEGATDFACQMIAIIQELSTRRRRNDHQRTLLRREGGVEMTLLQEALEVWDNTDLEQRQAAADVTEWDLADPTTRFRLAQLVHSWVHGERITKLTLEKRLRNAFLNNAQTERSNQPVTGVKPTTTDYGRGSYKAALCGTQQVDPILLDEAPTEELKLLTALCLQECETVEATRAPTSDEIKAIDLVLQQRIELPHPPLFIRQIMDIEEQAHFAHIFQTMEYPLYAHLDPGQFLQSEISPKVLFALIQVNDAASKEQQRQVASVKDATSRITLDPETRLLTFWFGSKTRARSWAGWKVPVATRTLQLYDYRALEDMPEEKRPITRFTSFRFQVVCKTGEMSPLSMQHLLCKELQLPVIQLSHPQLVLRCEDNGVWNAVTLGPRRPTILRQTTVIKYGKMRMTILLPDIYASKPCGHCKDHAHPSQRCTRTQAEATAHAKPRTKSVSTSRDPVKPPRTLDTTGVASYQCFVDYIATKRGTTKALPARSTSKQVHTPVVDSSDTLKDAQPQPDGPTAGAIGEVPQSVTPEESEDVLMTDGGELKEEESNCLAQCTPSMRTGGPKSPKRTHSVLEQDDEKRRMAAQRITRAIRRASTKRPRQAQADSRSGDILTASPRSANKAHALNQVTPVSPTPDQVKSPKRKLSALEQQATQENVAASRIIRAIRRASIKRQRHGTQYMHNSTTLAALPGLDKDPPTRLDGNRRVGSPTQQLFARKNMQESDEVDRRSTETTTAHSRKMTTSYIHEFFHELTKDATDDGDLTSIMDIDVSLFTEDGNDASLSSAAFSGDEDLRIPPTTQELHEAHPASLVSDVGLGMQSDIHTHLVKARCPAVIDLANEGDGVVRSADRPFAEVERPPTGSLQQLDAGQPLSVWLDLLDGKVTDVDGNGQCGWLAFYAALNNVRTDKLRLNGKTVTEATKLKTNVIRLMISRANDARTAGRFDYGWVSGLVEPPDPNGADDATWLRWLDAMMAQCSIPVDNHVSTRHWVSSAHIEAMAMLVREPVLIIDMVLPGTAYVQVYAFRPMPNQQDDLMEEGCCFPMTSTQAARLIHTFRREGLFPLVMLLRREQTGNHFQAITYTSAMYDAPTPDDHDPIESRNNILAVNGLPTLDAEMDDLDKLERDVTKIYNKARAVIKSAANRASGVDVNTSDDFAEPTWKPSRPTKRLPVHTEEEYLGLIGMAGTGKRDRQTNTLLAQLRQANQRAYERWYKSAKPEATAFRDQFPNMRMFNLVSELGDHPLAARDMIAAAPYPELLMRAIDPKAIAKWGQWEARDLQIRQLRQLERGTTTKSTTKGWIRTWISACDHADGAASFALTGSQTRWAELERQMPGVINRARPSHINLGDWHILHVLPFVYTKWHTSFIAQLPTSSRADWYDADPAVQLVCKGAKTKDWTALFQLRSGIQVDKSTNQRVARRASHQDPSGGSDELATRS